MISNKTKIEQSSSKLVNKNSLKKMKISCRSKKIPTHLWSSMGDFFQTKSEATIIKETIILLSGALVNSEEKYFDQLKYDQIHSIMSGFSSISDANKAQSSNEFIFIQVPSWQVALVASSLPKCISANEFIELSLEKACRRLSDSFESGDC